MLLIERDEPRAQLESIFVNVTKGGGRIVIISGQAGFGKTALVKHFRDTVETQADVLWGMCDDLYTPQALAPFYDIGFQLEGNLLQLLPQAPNLQLIGHTLLETLRKRSKPTVMVIEDIHWADEATLDVIRLLGRRIEMVPIMLIVTLRDPAIVQTPNLPVLLGGLPPGRTDRIVLAPLSREAIVRWAEADGREDADAIFKLTQGNPFYVTELLATPSGKLPQSIRDAVLAHAASLSAGARQVLNMVSIIPNQAEEWLIRDVIHLTHETLTEVLDSGMLVLQNDFLTFRHELARRAVAEVLTPVMARELHRAIFHALHAHERTGITLARLVHHAAYGDLGEAIVELAPRAARQASAVNAHREAAAHYATALRYTHLLNPSQRAALLEARAEACYLGVNWDVALRVYEQALGLWRQLGQDERVGNTLRRLSRLCWSFGQVNQARQYALETVRTLRRLPHGESLALAYSVLGQWHMHQNNARRTIYWSKKAVTLAQSLEAYQPLADALINIGNVLSKGADIPRGLRQLEDSLTLAIEHELPDQTARAYHNLIVAFIETRQLERATLYARRAMQHAQERDLNTYQYGVMAAEALITLHKGQWAESERISEQVISTFLLARGRGQASFCCASVLTQIAARRGAPDARDRMEDMLHKTQGHLDLPEDAGFIRLSRAEAAWLLGDYETCVAEARAMLTLLDGQVYLWYQSWSVFWLWRCGEPVREDITPIEPHRLQISGDWRGAAAAWAQHGYLYERAMALADGDEAALREAFAILDGLGARAATDYVRSRLRDLGTDSLPRGMNTATRENVAGLTRRQSEVLILLKQDLTNAEIASRLHISPKTVEHHVSAILGRLRVDNREEAIRVARSLDEET